MDTILKDNVADDVKSIIAETLDVNIEQLEDTADFVKDLGADSLEVLDLISTIEDRLGIEIPQKKVDEIKTVEQAIELVKENVPTRKNPPVQQPRPVEASRK